MTTAVAAPGSRRLNREDIVRLGQAGRPWDFIPLGMQATRLAPEDWGMRVLLAANLARLGLKTGAAEQLAALPEGVRSDDSVRGLVAAVGAMGGDRIGLPELEAVVRTNLGVLRGVELGPHISGWKVAAGAWEWFRASDGNIIRRRGHEWVGLADQRSIAAAFAREHLTKPDPQVNFFTIEGIDPPWLLQEVAKRTERAKDGFWPRLMVVQADPEEFLNGLAHADLTPVLSQDRTVVLVGADATAKLLAELRARLASRLSGAYIPQMRLGTKASPPVSTVTEQAESEQLAEHERLVREVTAVYAGRDRAWWRDRFNEPGPLRVLVPSCRYTTFVKHAGADLVEALKRMGCEAELLIEPDDSFRFLTLAYLRTIARLKPDLMILVNYMRQHIGDWVPRELPVLTWIQDAMPHQFDTAIGTKQGEFDFLAGHVWEELSRSFGFPSARTMHMPIVASTAKFHPGPADPALLRKHECEIALVSHHSETPERMHERLVDEAGRGTTIQRVLEELKPLVFELASAPSGQHVHLRLEAASREAIRKHLARDPEPKLLSLVNLNYCRPLADRVLRHQTLTWAAELARERGWRLHIYGRGWENHPTLAPFAQGELPHGEELRAAYRAATVHLHASINTIAHQRVMECALSGGLPLGRLTYELIYPIRVDAMRAAAAREAPTVGDPAQRLNGHFVADHPEAMAYMSLLQRLGRPADPFLWVYDKFRAPLKGPALPPHEANPAAWMLGDFGETTFESKARLGELVARAIESPAWRAGWSGFIAARVRERFTHGVFARRAIDLVKDSFGVGGG